MLTWLLRDSCHPKGWVCPQPRTAVYFALPAKFRGTLMRLCLRFTTRKAKQCPMPPIREMRLWLMLRVSRRGGRSRPSIGSIRQRTLWLTSRCRRAGIVVSTEVSSTCDTSYSGGGGIVIRFHDRPQKSMNPPMFTQHVWFWHT